MKAPPVLIGPAAARLAFAVAAQRAVDEERARIRQERLQKLSQTDVWAQTGRYVAGRLASAPFWCGRDRLHLESPGKYWLDLCCTQHAFGLPRHRLTDEPSAPVPHQLKFAEDVIELRRRSPGKALFHHLNKGRQMGFTEVAVRILAHNAFGPYAGRNVGIMAATNGRLARKDLVRLYRLFAHHPSVVKDPLKGNSFSLINGTTFEAFPATEEAMTGLTRYGGILLDEAAKWRLVDDRPVFNSVEPIVRSSGADLFLVSTPKGPQKMFWRIHREPRDYRKHLYTIWEAQGSMYTAEQIRHMLATSQADPQQEYLGQFTIGEDSVFGMVDDDERVAGVREWDWDGLGDGVGGLGGGGRPAASEDDGYIERGEPLRDGDWPSI